MHVWLNDALGPAEQLRIDPRDRGLLLGDGLFETLLAVDGQPMYFPDHLARLRSGCRLLDLPLRWSNAALAAAVRSVLEANRLTRGRAAVRLTLTRGVGPRGLRVPADPVPNLLLSAVLAPSARDPLRAIISHYRRNEHSPLCRVKSLSYLESVLAAEEARRAGAEEAILLNSAGQLAEASAANVFLVRERRLVTPRLCDGALPGVMRARVLQLAPRLGLQVTEQSCAVADLLGAEEVFLTNSVVVVRPVVQIDDAVVGAGVPGPCVASLRAQPEIARQI